MPTRPDLQPSDEAARGMVSVVTIFLNAETFLEEAIESVRAQTFPAWELLLVDDGSSDGSSEIARRHAERDPGRVRYLAHPGHLNRGMSASRNLGIRHAKGEFIALLDADDVWLPEKLERQVALLRRHARAQMVYGPSRLWYGWTGDPQDAAADDWRRTGVRHDRLFEPPDLLTLLLRGKARSPATCSVLLRREAVHAVGGFEEEFRGMYEDQAFFSKVFYHLPVYVSDESWDKYRQHPGSACSTATESGEYHPEMPHPARLSFLTWLESYLAGHEPRDDDLWSALQGTIWLQRHPRIHRSRARLRLASDRIKGVFWKGLLPFAFSVGRLVLPSSLRRWMWHRWLK